jgi:hypothetical protein
MLFQQTSVFSHPKWAGTWIEISHANGLADAAVTWPPRSLTSYRFISRSGCTFGMLFTLHNCPQLCPNFQDGYKLLRLQLHPPFLQVSGLNLEYRRDMHRNTRDAPLAHIYTVTRRSQSLSHIAHRILVVSIGAPYLLRHITLKPSTFHTLAL